MKIYDMHIHSFNHTPAHETLLAEMEKSGVYGGCVFSNWPKEANPSAGTSFEERLEEVLSWTRGYEDRLFPVMWIHPYEEDIIPNIRKAAAAGIAGFKIICTDFYVSETKSMDVIQEIANLDLPLFFHSGILWDCQVSSQYNRPLNWESLLDIVGLRFSMGHCSWPWIDECIALYGKLRAARRVRPDMSCRMFIDITPGTPDIYRKELMTKLHFIGYELDQAVLFGSDSRVQYYSGEGIRRLRSKDDAIYDELGISEAARENIYGNNLLRFFGIER